MKLLFKDGSGQFIKFGDQLHGVPEPFAVAMTEEETKLVGVLNSPEFLWYKRLRTPPEKRK